MAGYEGREVQLGLGVGGQRTCVGGDVYVVDVYSITALEAFKRVYEGYV